MAAPSFRTSSAGSTSIANRSTLAIVVDAQAVAGDIHLVVIQTDDAKTITPPSGWTLIAEAGSGPKGYLYWHRLVGGEPGSTVNFTWTTNTWSQGGQISIKDAIASGDPQDATATSNTGTGTSPTALALTTVTADCLIVAAIANVDGGAHTPASSGMTERLDANSVAFYDVAQASPGTTGNKVLSGPTSWITFLIALKPVAAATTSLPLPPQGRWQQHQLVR